jgi:hypothetical protein
MTGDLPQGGTMTGTGPVTTSALEVRLNARLHAVQRGDRYEDPLAYWLEERFPGSRVVAAGTLVSPLGEPLSCAVRADVVGRPASVLDEVVMFLEDLGTPKGSVVVVDEIERGFGTNEGLALYLDGANLSPEVYATLDVNEFLDELHESLGGTGTIQGFWESDDTTGVYLYGASAELMTSAIDDLLTVHPLARGSRLERRA